MSKKPRARSASQDAAATAPSPARPEPSVFRDMRIEEGRTSDGRRIIYFAWPDDVPAAEASAEAGSADPEAHAGAVPPNSTMADEDPAGV